jgi:hypothetical protein
LAGNNSQQSYEAEVNMNRREFLKQSAAASLIATASHSASPEPPVSKKLNVLYIFSDQHRAQSLPGEPLNLAEAPAFDRFRHQNLSMDAAFPTTPYVYRTAPF